MKALQENTQTTKTFQECCPRSTEPVILLEKSLLRCPVHLPWLCIWISHQRTCLALGSQFHSETCDYGAFTMMFNDLWKSCGIPHAGKRWFWQNTSCWGGWGDGRTLNFPLPQLPLPRWGNLMAYDRRGTRRCYAGIKVAFSAGESWTSRARWNGRCHLTTGWVQTCWFFHRGSCLTWKSWWTCYCYTSSYS